MNRHLTKRHIGARWLGLVVLATTPCIAAEPPQAAPRPEVAFESAVAPIFKAKCVRCHGQKTRKSGLDLSSAAGIQRGASGGAIVTPGNVDESPLFDMVGDDLMPPEDVKPRLTPEEVATIRQWIESGAHFDKAGKSGGDWSAQLTQHDVTPIFLLRCTVCHGLRRQEGGLDLRTKASMLKGGKSGPAMVPGDPEKSLLVKRVQAGEMPPPRKVVSVSVKPMPAPELAKVVAWIKAGAPESDEPPDVATTEPDPEVSDEKREFWAFQPPRPTDPPEVKDTSRVRNPIDAFLQAKLEAKGLSLSPEADRRTLLRRAYFDLIGLPPAPADVEAFLADKSPDAYEKLIDRLLASPHYGERWGRHWLDVAGYSDSEGKTSQDEIRPASYRYRDYVIRAFNADKPYDRFLLEQIAGDELADYDHAPEITQEIYDNLVATGFLRMAADGTWANITNFVPDRLDVIADDIQVLGSGVMGLTLNCCRCHDHKFDPLPQRDYYRLAAVLKPALDEHDWMGPKDRYLHYGSPEETKRIEANNRPLDEEIAKLNAALADETEKLRQKLFNEKLPTVPEVLRADVKAAFETASKKRTEIQKYLVEKFKPNFILNEAALAKADPDYKKLRDETAKKTKELAGKKLPRPMIRALWDRGSPSPSYLLKRGDYLNPGRPVGPGVPSVLTDGKTPFEVSPPWPGAKSTGRRLALARWLVRPENPLTARVLVNRVWSLHFGRGIVPSLGNFGRAGLPPSHPKLLDWLAIEFVKNGWSIKHLHRLMMTSNAYRQPSDASDESRRLDPDGALLSRMPLERLDAESVYDSILQTCGALDDTPFGPPDGVDVRGDGLVTPKKTDKGLRRSVYVRQRRTEIPTLLDNFDFPQMSPNCLQRRDSIVATQALHLMNNAMIHDLARRFAQRVVREAGADPKRQIEQAYRIALSRPPSESELQAVGDVMAQLTAQWTKTPGAQTLALEAVASTWIREIAPDQPYEKDRIWVTSAGAIDKGRRYGLVEFDVSKLAGLDVSRAYLDLAVMSPGEMRQAAASIPPGIAGATWSSFLQKQASKTERLDSLGSYKLVGKEGTGGGYVPSANASPRDVELLEAKAKRNEHLAMVLMPADGDGCYQREWDDGVSPGSRGKPPRLIVHFGSQSPKEAALDALANVCHALLNSSEFVYVD
jgi:mono/diheme cytochrome c family protein